MKEVSQDTGLDQFVQTPLQFFGAGPELYFGYPPEFDSEITAAQAASVERVVAMGVKRQELIESGDPHSYDYRRFVPDDAFQDTVEYEKRKATGDVKQTWYERRMRGGFGDMVDPAEYPEASKYINWVQYHRIGPTELPAGEKIAAYLTARLSKNAWSSAFEGAEAWYENLPEDHEDKPLAKDYVGFAGNIILTEYCKIALAHANNTMANDESVQTKHLLTVCWPTALALEAFIPEEVAQKKQLLREVFLQFTINGLGSVRRDADRLGYLQERKPKTTDERLEIEEANLARFMRFDEAEVVDREAMFNRVIAVADQLTANQQWSQAAQFLDLARLAFGFAEADIRQYIDRLLIDGALALTEDMGEFEKLQVKEHRGHHYGVTNANLMTGLSLAYGMSDDISVKIRDIEQNRLLEHRLQRLSETEGPEHDKYLKLIFESLEETKPEAAARFANQDAVEEYIDLLSQDSCSRLSDLALDGLVRQIIRLRNQGVFSSEQQNQVLLTLGDSLLTRIIDGPRSREDFDRLIGYMSPILRATLDADTPEEEIIWKFLPQKRFATAMDALITEYSDEWLEERREAFSTDIRQAWGDYWDIREEY